mgnify:CR=1 FL=1
MQRQIIDTIVKISVHDTSRCIVSGIDRKAMDFYEVGSKDMDGIVNQLRNIEGISCAIFMYETGVLQYKVSLRPSSLPPHHGR